MAERINRFFHTVGRAARTVKNVADTVRVTPGMEIGVRTGDGSHGFTEGIVVETHHLRGEIVLQVGDEKQVHPSNKITFLNLLLR